MHKLARLMAMTGMLLAPVIAAASSEYRACMEAQQRLSLPATYIAGSRSYGPSLYGSAVGLGSYTYSYHESSISFAYSSISTMLSTGSAWREADRVSAMARNCRQYRKSNPPKFRVVTMKSPSQRSTVNGGR